MRLLVEDAEDDVDHKKGEDEEKVEARKRAFKNICCSDHLSKYLRGDLLLSQLSEGCERCAEGDVLTRRREATS